MKNVPHPEAAFTLLEMVIALAILALGAAGLVSAATQATRQTAALEQKTFAAWVAENTLSEIRAAREWPALGVQQNTTEMAGRSWNIRTTIAATDTPEIRRIEVAVSPATAPAQNSASASLTGYLGRY